jgi:hypothetical protein
MSAKGGAQRLDREIQARIEATALPHATRSTVVAVPESVRIRLHDGAVEIDDVTHWMAVGEQQLEGSMPVNGGPPWTHVLAAPLAPSEPSTDLHSPELVEALRRAKGSSNTALELQGKFDDGHYTLFVDGDALYEDTIRLIYNAEHAELVRPWLAVRREDGTIGTLPVGKRNTCSDAMPTRRCFEAYITVAATELVVRGYPSEEHDGRCLRLGGDEPTLSRLLPCRRVQAQRIAARPAVLHDVLAELASGEPCKQVMLAASGSTDWQAVITAFDAMRSLGHDWIVLRPPDADADVGAECEQIP